MPNPVQVTVCVIALTQGDYNDFDLAVQARLAGFFASPGKPYHKSSPDEWRPFNVDSVSQSLTNASIQASFLSLQLDNDTTRTKALKETRLFIVDPLVLFHGIKGARLAAEIQNAIYFGEKAFGIILPAAIPDPLRKEIQDCCQTKLTNLWTSWKDQDDAELVLTHDHLQKYLARLVRHLASKPNQEMLELARAVLTQSGVASPALSQPPLLVKS